MKKRFLTAIAVLSLAVPALWSCHKNTSDTDGQAEPAELVALKASVPVTEDWIFNDKPGIVIKIENSNDVPVTAQVSVKITKDTKESVEDIDRSVEVPAGGSTELTVTTTAGLDPGFYRARCLVNKNMARNFCFGINPMEIVSAPDKQPDFDAFWEAAKEQLKGIDMNAALTEITTKSNSNCKVWLVEMNSVPDGPEGDPVVVRGYYLEPRDGGTHPVIMHFYGYDELRNPAKLSCPSGNNGEYAEFYLSHRGQYINNRRADRREPDGHGDFENPYGDWFAFNFGNRDGYYYRGAFMDCVQAVRFMATRTTSDMGNLFAEGSSQGGALSYAAAALSDIPFTAIAPNVAFLGDYPDYFRIVSWPGDVAKKNKGSMTDDEMYAFLSYFDTKNLATRISCAVYATIGLQDETCPPHTNLAAYSNLASTDREVHFYPEMQHAYPTGWSSAIMKYFKDRIKN